MSIKKEPVNSYDHTRQPHIPASDIYRLLNFVPGACQNSGEESYLARVQETFIYFFYCMEGVMGA